MVADGPGGPTERIVTYYAPFFKPDREEDYLVAWAFFEMGPDKRALPELQNDAY